MAQRINQLEDAHLQKADIETNINQNDTIDCLKLKCPNHSHRSRCISMCSQATLLTTVSRPDVLIKMDSIDNNVKHNNSTNGNCPRDDRTTLSTIAEKLRRGTRKVLQFKTTSPNSSTTTSSHQQQQVETVAIGTTATSGNEAKLQKVNSVDTNTISNSSLQEVDGEEFDSAELAKYMGEINQEIR